MSMNKKVEDLNIDGDTTISELISGYQNSGGFVAKKVGLSVEILDEMFQTDGTNFLSFPAAIVSTGTRGVLKEAVKRELFDVIITTCGTLDHDLARVWEDYYHGSFDADDKELHEKDVNRLGNIFIPNSSYGEVLEEKMQPMIEDIVEEKGPSLSTREIIWEFGKRIDDKDSILYWAAENEIPIYVPGITDGAFGFQLWMYWQKNKDFSLDLMKDEEELSREVFSADKSGALIVGGGISKHHTIWWNQFKDGLDHAVYVTTAVEYDGSLSGARAEEAISWGKINEKADHCTVKGDATVLVPLMLANFF
ncbi:MAG: deoxyhypusine synthase [Candidatus Thermoplasmatota archaeon]|nr:deoxyhypusine synthase [Candidatus Thermoplasmatota archaeon]